MKNPKKERYREAVRKTKERCMKKTENLVPIIVKLIEEGHSLRQTAEELGNLGYSREGQPFTVPSVQSIIRYRGLTVAKIKQQKQQKEEKESNNE